MSEGSFFRRKKIAKPSLEESERLMRLGRVFEQAVALHDGDQDAAREWLETPMTGGFIAGSPTMTRHTSIFIGVPSWCKITA